MFNSILVYQLPADWTAPDLQALQDKAQALAYEPCGPTQQESKGWVPPRNQNHGVLVESVDGQWIFKLMVEKKSVPAAEVKKELTKLCEQIEQQTGRKPGKKAQRELKDEIILKLLPRAFSKISALYLWLDKENKRLIVGSTSKSNADKAITAMVELMAGLSPEFAPMPVISKESVESRMSAWLMEAQAPAGFQLGMNCELAAVDESRSVVRYVRHPLDGEDMTKHLESNKRPTALELSWDGKISFVLCDNLSLKKIEYLEDLFAKPEGEDRFDADVALTTGTLQAFLPKLFAELGGLQGDAPVEA